MFNYWETLAFMATGQGEQKIDLMNELGILERLELKIEQLTTLVLRLYESSGDGIGRVMYKDEAAEYLGISKSALESRITKGQVPYIHDTRNRVVFTEHYLKLAQLSPSIEAIEELTEEMRRKFSRRR